MNHLENIPFETIPRIFIDQLNSCGFTYDDYLAFCPLYNALPTYWNMAVTQDDKIVAVVWGTLEPLERFIHVTRISVLPSARKEVRIYIADSLRAAGKKMGALKIFFITDRPSLFLNNAPTKLSLSEGKIVEVRLNENLH